VPKKLKEELTNKPANERATMKCKICNREAALQGFCALHSKAYENVVEKYTSWQKASNMPWRQYLLEIQKNSLTGEWAKEVAKHLIEEENKDVKQI
jgi:hypothetical protein